MYIRSTNSKLGSMNENIKVIENISVNQDFFELVRRIDKVWDPYLRLGRNRDKYFQKIRIVQPADMSFASREVVAIRQIVKGKEELPLVVIESRHFGLFAPYGPMPIFVTEHARSEALLRRNRAFEQFMNMLSQRFAIFQYCCWSQLHVAIGHDKPESNVFQNKIDKVVGIKDVKSIYDKHIRRVRRSYPGAYVKDRISLSQLQKIIEQYFGVRVRIIQRYPTWIEHKDDFKLILGKKLLGKRFYNIEYNALIELGPFYDKSYLDFDRREEKLKVLIEICNDFVNYLLSFDVILYVETNPEWRVNINNMKVGKNSWLKPKKQVIKKLVYSLSINNKLI